MSVFYSWKCDCCGREGQGRSPIGGSPQLTIIKVGAYICGEVCDACEARIRGRLDAGENVFHDSVRAERVDGGGPTFRHRLDYLRTREDGCTFALNVQRAAVLVGVVPELPCVVSVGPGEGVREGWQGAVCCVGMLVIVTFDRRPEEHPALVFRAPSWVASDDCGDIGYH